MPPPSRPSTAGTTRSRIPTAANKPSLKFVAAKLGAASNEASAEATSLAGKSRRAQRKHSITAALADGMKTIDESSDEPPPSARLRNTPTTIDPLLSGLGELLDAGSPALAGFLARRGKAERVSSRLLAFSRNPEQHTERFLATWRAHPHLALKIAYHGTKAQNVSSICASGLRPAHAGGAAFLGATITKAISYCDWRLAPDFQPHDPSEKWCPTGVVVVCALLVDPHPSDAAATTALSSETKPAASKTSSSSAFESPNFVGNDAGEIWPPAPNSTVALHEDDFAKHLPLGVMAVTSQPLIDHERDGPSASIAKLLKLRTAALAPERQAT